MARSSYGLGQSGSGPISRLSPLWAPPSSRSRGSAQCRPVVVSPGQAVVFAIYSGEDIARMRAVAKKLRISRDPRVGSAPRADPLWVEGPNMLPTLPAWPLGPES
jgi:hypothetical protein